jgi:hypothetical protein
MISKRPNPFVQYLRLQPLPMYNHHCKRKKRNTAELKKILKIDHNLKILYYHRLIHEYHRFNLLNKTITY